MDLVLGTFPVIWSGYWVSGCVLLDMTGEWVDRLLSGWVNFVLGLLTHNK